MDINKVIAIVRRLNESPWIIRAGSRKKSSYRGPTGDHKRDEHGHIVASHYNKTKTEYPPASPKKGKKKKGPIDWQKTKKKGYKKKSKEPKQSLPWKPKTPEERKKILSKWDKVGIKKPSDMNKTEKGKLTNKIVSRYKKKLKEDAPTMSMGGGGIAGSVEANDDPPVNKKKKKNIYMGLHSRKRWLDFTNGKGSGKS